MYLVTLQVRFRPRYSRLQRIDQCEPPHPSKAIFVVGSTLPAHKSRKISTRREENSYPQRKILFFIMYAFYRTTIVPGGSIPSIRNKSYSLSPICWIATIAICTHLWGVRHQQVDAFVQCCSVTIHSNLRLQKQQQFGMVLPPLLSARRDDQQNDNDGNSSTTTPFPPGYKFFQGDGSYVPSGMTREEYQKLRQREVDYERTMNYGAWGPRFQRTGIPMGDWMVMPNLWTLGQVSRRNSSPADNNRRNVNSGVPPFMGGIVHLVRTYTLSFVLGYFILTCLEVGYWVFRWKVYEMTPGMALLKMIKMLVLRKGLIAATLATIESVKVVLAALLTPAIHTILERTNRRFLWSKSQTTLTASSVVLFGLLTWGALLKVIRFQ
jgi:hypothetical protein